MKRETKNQKAWTQLFDTRPILKDLNSQSFHLISAQEIGDEREARLMTKFDRKDSLPDILKAAECAPISISRSHYALVRPGNSLFKDLDEVASPPVAIATNTWKDKVLTIPWEQVLQSESQAIDLAYLLPVFRNFFGESGELWATIRGRSTLKGEVPLRIEIPGAGIKDFPFKANGVQVEFDGGYESPAAIYLIEAKVKIPKDFNLRQFYFPYWHWVKTLQALGKNKPVKLIFLVYSGHVYYLYEYKFEDPTVINSLVREKSARFIVGEMEFSWRELAELTGQNVTPVDSSEVPFPQADEFERVINVVESIKIAEEKTAYDLAEAYDFTPRQGDYYANAARWLGWLSKAGENWEITTSGRALLESNSPSQMVRVICNAFFERPVLREGLVLMAREQSLPDKEELEPIIISASKLKKIKTIGGSTVPRRAQTIRSWLKYILDLIKE